MKNSNNHQMTFVMLYICRFQKEGGAIIRGGAILRGNTVFCSFMLCYENNIVFLFVLNNSVPQKIRFCAK